MASILEYAHASFSRRGERKSMELPGKSQGNPDGSLWAADVAHSAQKPTGGGHSCRDTNKCLPDRGFVFNITLQEDLSANMVTVFDQVTKT